jgi:hypothetical protein
MVYAYNMARHKKKEHDFAVTAFRVVQKATEQQETEAEQVNTCEKKFDPVALGHLGGLKGGKARAEKLTPERRSEIAKIAASARWRKKD